MNEKFLEKVSGENMFRVMCLNPSDNGQRVIVGAMILPGGKEVKLMSGVRLCCSGIPMTLNELNDELIWEGKPYINIPYCKYCYSDKTIGVFDDDLFFPYTINEIQRYFEVICPGDYDEEGEIVTKFIIEEVNKEVVDRYYDIQDKLMDKEE